MTPTPESIARKILDLGDLVADRSVEMHFRQNPALLRQYPAHGRQRCLEDARFHLQYLASALRCGRPALFSDYLVWATRLLAGRNVPASDLHDALECIAVVLDEHLPPEAGAIVREYLGIPGDSPSTDSGSFLASPSPVSELRERYLQLLLDRQRHEATRTIQAAVDAGLSLETSYLEIFQPVQYEVGRLWHLNRITVAQEHYCTAVTQSIMAQFYSRLFSTPRTGGRAVVSSVGRDLHEIGGRMVADLLEFNGWDTVYLGASTPHASIASMVCQHHADVVALSVTMTYHLGPLEEAIRTIRSTPGCERTRILVGGRPFLLEPDLWRELGADGSARDAREAVVLANELTARSR